MFEEAGEDGAGDGVGREFDCLAAVGDDDAVIPIRRKLRGEPAEFVAQGEVGFHHGKGLGIDAGHVDRVADLAIEEGGADGLGDLDADVFLGFRGGGTGCGVMLGRVRRGSRKGRFHLEDVERGSGDVIGSSASPRAASSMSPPRAQLTMRMPFAERQAAGVDHVLRSSVRGMCIVRKSQRGRRSSICSMSSTYEHMTLLTER